MPITPGVHEPHVAVRPARERTRVGRERGLGGEERARLLPGGAVRKDAHDGRVRRADRSRATEESRGAAEGGGLEVRAERDERRAEGEGLEGGRARERVLNELS